MAVSGFMNLLKNIFFLQFRKKPNRPLIVRREGRSIHDPHLYVYDNQRPSLLTTQTD